jgi:MscS family membrane protein
MDKQILLELFLGSLVWFALYFVCKKVLSLCKKRQKIKVFHWERVFLTPMKLFFLSIGLYYGASLLGSQFGYENIAFSVVAPICHALGVLSLAWMAFRWKEERLHRGASKGLSKLFSAGIVILSALLILRAFHLDIVPLLAFGGIGAAALGFAAKDVMSNFFGGMMLSVTKPFSIGDDILLPDRNIEGKVEEIGWYQTEIRDKYRRPVYLPNALFSHLLVINQSRMTHRRIFETLQVRHEDLPRLDMITEKITQSLRAHPHIDTEAPLLVYFHNVGTYNMDIYLDVYTKETELDRYLAVRQEVLKLVLALIYECGANISHPVITSLEVRA